MEPAVHPLESILAAAVEIDAADERRAFVEQACAGDAELKRRVLQMIADHFQAGSFLEPVQLPSSRRGPQESGGPTLDEPILEKPGAMIGPYKLMEQIGEGGFGLVFVAEQIHPVRRRVALKVIKPGMDTRQVIARFEAERQALALMDHPNIAKVLDAGATAGGRPYFVMELVKGVPITQFCDEQKLTPRQRLEPFLSVCQAVQHAHQKGIIHRDLKPSNVLVTSHDGKPVVKVIDFGVAKAIGQQLTDKTVYTQLAQLIGTPLYMSPEQAGQSGMDVDTRSDIYSLGVLLYELLTGTTPFSKERFQQAAYDEIRRIIREEDPPKPSTRLSELSRLGEPSRTLGAPGPARLAGPTSSLASVSAMRQTEPAKLTKLVRGELDWIVMKALEKDRNRRYETANGFAMDVQRYLADEPVQACPPSVGYRVRKFARRNKVALTVAALVTALLFVAVAVLAVANYEINNALADKSKANDELGLAKQETEKANTDLKGTLAALTREQRETKLALDKERLTLYYHRIAMAHREWSANNVGRADHLLDECPKELRHWEWHYMKRLCNAELFTLRGHDTQINCMAYSPDGRWIASGDLQGIRIWDAARGSNLRTLPNKSAVSALAFSPDSKRLGFTDWKGNITLYDLGREGEVSGQRTIAALKGVASCVAFSPDGSRLAAGGKVSAVKVFNVQTGQEVLALPLDYPACQSVEFSSDGRFLVTAAHESTIKVWDAATGQVKHGDWRQVYSVSKAVAFSPDSNFLATGQGDVVSVWNLNSGKLSLRLTGHTGPVMQIAYSPDGRHLASADTNGRLVRVWDLTTPEQPIVTLRGHADTIYALSYSPDGRRLASAGLDKVVKVWHTRHAPEGLYLRTEDAGRISYSAKAERVASIHRDTILVWDALTGRELARLKTEVARSNTRRPVALSPDGRYVVSAGEDETTLRLWDVETQQELRVVGSHARVHALTFSPDGARLASGARDGTVLLWDAATGKKLSTLAGHKGSVIQLAFSPDGRRLASASLDGSAKLWEAGTGQVLHTLGGHGRPVSAVAFSSDGKSLLSGGDDGTVKQWDVSTGQELHTFDGHGIRVHGVALSPDGSRLAAALHDGSVVLWDTLNKREAITLQPGAATSFSVAYSRDGLRLLTSNQGIKIFNAAPWTDKASPALDAENLIDWTYWRDLAKNQGIVKRWKEAVAYYSKAIDLKPDDAFCWNARGFAHRRLGEKEKALADYTKASNLQPKEALYWRNRASLYTELGQHDKAIADYSVAIKLKPDDAISWNERGVVYGRLEKNEKALADHVKASELKPSEPQYWYNRGSMYAQLAQHDKAVVDYSKAIDLKPNDAQWRHVRGMSYFQLGQKDKALADYIKATELKPKEAQYWRDRASMHAKLNQHAKAVADYSMAIELKPDDAYSWNARGVAHSRLNQKEKALADYIKASDLKPKQPLYWYNRGSVNAQMGQHDKAVADYSTAIDLKPEDAYWRHMRGIAHGRLGQWNEALADHAKAAELKPTDPRYCTGQGFACAQLGQWEKAAAAFEHATTLKPHYPLAWYYLALSELQRGDRAGYRKVCSGMLERFGQSANADAAYWLAWTCILIPDAVADWTKPLKLAEKAHADDGKNFEKIDQLGALLYRAGRFKEAAQLLTEADTAFKPTPSARSTIVYNWLFQAMTHHRLGRPADAALWLEKAVRAIDEPAPESAQDPATNIWNRRLTLQLLRREAEELLGKTSK